MRTADLYAGLDWGSFELLIPQEDISDAELDTGKNGPAISIDGAVRRAFGRDFPEAVESGNGMLSYLAIRGKSYATALMPQVIRIDGEQGPLPDCKILAPSFERHGLKPIAITGGKDSKIRYIVDMEKFTAGENI